VTALKRLCFTAQSSYIADRYIVSQKRTNFETV